MRYALGVIAFTAGLAVVPAVAHASMTPQQAQAAAKAKPAKAATKTATHATTGVVKSIDPTSLVITRSGKQSGDMTFVVSASTHQDGTIVSGAPVSVRYREEGANHVATAITVQHPKHQAADHT